MNLFGHVATILAIDERAYQECKNRLNQSVCASDVGSKVGYGVILHIINLRGKTCDHVNFDLIAALFIVKFFIEIAMK